MFKNPPYLIPIAIISILTAIILIKCEERSQPMKPLDLKAEDVMVISEEPKEPVKVYKDTNGFVTNVIRKEMRKLWSKEEVNHPNCGNMKNDYEYPVADLSCTDARTGERRVAYFNLNSAKRFIDTDNPNIKWLGQIFNGYECGLHPDGFMVWREAK